ncbi:MAG: hypothetical protein PVF05_06875 [Gemmatimonadales bacterium]|jgi:hypothetical protein
MSRQLGDVEPRTGAVLGGVSLLVGTFICLVALDWIEVDPASIHAPRWVLGVCGGIFVITGLATLYYAVVNALGRGPASGPGDAFPVVAWLVGLVIAGGLAAVATWIAFGPGERSFTASIGVGGAGARGAASELVGRWVFGFGAVVTWAFTLWTLAYGVRRLFFRGEAPRIDTADRPE